MACIILIAGLNGRLAFAVLKKLILATLVPAALSSFAPLAYTQVSGRNSDAATHLENQVKAAYLYKFAHYVDWPAAAMLPPGSPIVIGVIGADGLAEELQKASATHQVKNRPVQVRQLRAGDPAIGLHILYVGALAGSRGKLLLDSVATRPVLTVTEAADFTAAGSIVNFVLVDDRLRFEVSLKQAENCGLAISARLLTVAYRIEGRAP